MQLKIIFLGVLVVVALAVAFTAGWFAGRKTSDNDQARKDISAISDKRLTAATDCGADNERLRQQVARLEKQADSASTLAALQAALAASRAGDKQPAVDEETPVPWPDDVPVEYSPEGFKRIVGEAVEHAGQPGELLDVDCQELPCVAVIRPGPEDKWFRKVIEAPSWTENYDPGISLKDMSRVCDDGREDRMTFLGKIWDEADGLTKAHAILRFNRRWNVIVDKWMCLPENE